MLDSRHPRRRLCGRVDAAAASRRSELFWVGGGRLHSRTPPATDPACRARDCDVDAPGAIAEAARLIAWRKWLWG